MIDLSWKVFSKTGNIETYLLMKELEMTYEQTMNNQPRDQDQVEDGFKHIK
ncbi:YqzL-like protein [Melghiribacillus thermohalophilus]|uniref:YqzL-like protein n=1 Tax=Melghiribacillus thermohalophilus TaxID=1324956 RepID=A0A4V2V2Y6_9BACI|nr:YqzL family protein [Melghiribacillus thermohalophilus]TCT27011.1 YqzL-like protein [Melghiribacillus thermohalophilus]